MAFEDSGQVFGQPEGETPTELAPPAGDTPPAPGTPPAPVETWDVPGMGSLTRDEIVKGYLRQQDYSRKTMQLSQQQRDYESVRQQAQSMEQALTQVRDFLQDRTRLEAYLKTLPGAEPQLDPSQVLTAAEANQLVQRRLGESEATFQKRFQQAQAEIMTQVYEAQYGSAIENRLRDIGGKFPELRSVPGMEVLLRQAVQSQRPRDINEALQLFDQAAEFYAGRFKEMVQSTVARPNNPVNRGIQPPNTAAPMPDAEPTDFTGIKDPRLRDLVMKDITAALSR